MDTSEILRPFVKDMRHLTSQLNNIASDMIRDKALAKKLDDDPDYFRKTYSISEEELAAMRERNLPSCSSSGCTRSCSCATWGRLARRAEHRHRRPSAPRRA